MTSFKGGSLYYLWGAFLDSEHGVSLEPDVLFQMSQGQTTKGIYSLQQTDNIPSIQQVKCSPTE